MLTYHVLFITEGQLHNAHTTTRNAAIAIAMLCEQHCIDWELWRGPQQLNIFGEPITWPKGHIGVYERFAYQNAKTRERAHVREKNKLAPLQVIAAKTAPRKTRPPKY